VGAGDVVEGRWDVADGPPPRRLSAHSAPTWVPPFQRDLTGVADVGVGGVHAPGTGGPGLGKPDSVQDSAGATSPSNREAFAIAESPLTEQEHALGGKRTGKDAGVEVGDQNLGVVV
jgi:hypothetical protein